MRHISFSLSASVVAALLAVFTAFVFQQGPSNFVAETLRFLKHQQQSITNSDTTSNTPSIKSIIAGWEPQEPVIAKNMSVLRAIRKVFLATEQAEGAGARVRRSVGTPALRNFSPFLMLDHFSVKPGAGFPDHPHRGQETITYLLQGAFDHEDFTGHAGTIEAGDLQFMTAGRGIMHAEMPRQNPDGSANVGLQLWVDLPKQLKSCEPRYRDLRAQEIPVAKIDDGKAVVKVISGKSAGVDSVQDLAYTPVWLLDFTVQSGGHVAQEIPKGWNAFVYVLEGEATFLGPTPFSPGEEVQKRLSQEEGERRIVKQYEVAVFERDNGDGIRVEVADDAKTPARFVLIAGQVLDQEIVQYGPFVVSSKQEAYEAMMDFRTQSNGFERAKGWESKIGKSLMG